MANIERKAGGTEGGKTEGGGPVERAESSINIGMIECDGERRRRPVFQMPHAKDKGKEVSPGKCSEEGGEEMGNRKRRQAGGK